jgi:hypothetical protein
MKMLEHIRECYETAGYVRVKMDRRRKGVRSGWEIRVPFADLLQLRRASEFLERHGIETGSPFDKHSRHILPIYGKARCEKFLSLVQPQVKQFIEDAPKAVDMRLREKKR